MGSSVAHSQSRENVSFQFAKRQRADPFCAASLSRKRRTLGKRRTSAHHGARNIFCGVGRWCGNHFACNQRSSSLDFTDKSITVSTNMYVADPTQESIQLKKFLGRRVPRWVS